CAAYAAGVFNLGIAPMLRVGAGKIANGNTYLCIAVHHIVCDGWALELVFDELTTEYLSIKEGHVNTVMPSLQYRDFINMEEQILQNEKLRDYWSKQIANLKPTIIDKDSGFGPENSKGEMLLTISGDRLL